jgi:uncharacterized protein (DUF849 family)
MGSGRCTFVLDGPDDHLASRVVQLSHRHFRAVPDGALLTVESSMRNVLPVNMWGISMGLHVRCGIEDNLWNQARTAKFSTVEQVRQLVRISKDFGRPIATGKQAKELLGIGKFYDTVEESLAANGFAPNRNGGNQGFLRKHA